MEEQFIFQLGISAFVVVTLLLGLRKPARSFHVYASGGGELKGGLLLMTLVATLISSKEIWLMRSFSKGIITVPNVIIPPLIAMLLGNWVFPKLVYYKKHLTLSGVMQEIYGKTAGYITSVVGIIACFLVIVAQLAFLKEFASFVGMEPTHLVICFGVLITLYTCLGGMKGVAVTDVMQFICMAIGILVFALFVLQSSQDQKGKIATEDHYTFWTHPHPGGRFLTTFFWAIWPTLFLFPPVLQRVLAIPTKDKIRNTFIGVSFIYFIIRFAQFLLGLFLAENRFVLGKKGLFFSKILEIGTTNPIARLAMLLAALAIAMSTIDSFLHACSIDLVLLLNKLAPQKIKKERLVPLSILSSFAIGSLATCLALCKLVPNELIGVSYILFGVLFIPILTGLLGLKGNSILFVSNLCIFWATFSAGFLFFWLRKGEILSIIGKGMRFSNTFQIARAAWFFGIVVSTLCFFIGHRFIYGKWAWVKREEDFFETKQGFKGREFKWLASPKAWAEAKVKRYGKAPYLLGFFLYISILIPYFVTQQIPAETYYIVLALKAVGILLATGLLLEASWPKPLQPYLNLYYFFTLFFCIPFNAWMIALQDPQGAFTVSYMVLSFVLLIVLVDWRTFIGLNAIGLACSLLLRYAAGAEAVWFKFEGHQGLILAFNAIYTLAVCLLFARKKERLAFLQEALAKKRTLFQQKQLQMHQQVHEQLSHSVDPRSSVMSACKEIIGRMRERQYDQQDTDRLMHVIDYFHELNIQAAEFLPLHPQKGSLRQLLRQVAVCLKWQAIESQHVSFAVETAKDEFVADLSYVEKLLEQAVLHQMHSKPGAHVYFRVEAVQLDYSPEGRPEKVAGLRFVVSYLAPEPKETPEAAPIVHLPERMTWVAQEDHYLQSNRRITLAHYGAMLCEQSALGLEQTYLLPLNLNEVRPKIGRFVDEHLDVETRPV